MSGDCRDVDRVEATIREEFEFHVAACAAELERTGWSADAARGEALRRFGRFERYERACRREAPEETMGTKTTVALTVGLVALAGSIVFLARAVTRQGEVVAALEARIAANAARDVDAHLPAAASNSEAEAQQIVYIDGAVARPGVYELPRGGVLTTSRLLIAAGVQPIDLRVLVMPALDSPTRLAQWKQSGGAVDTRDGQPCMVVERTAREGVMVNDLVLRAGDKLWIAGR